MTELAACAAKFHLTPEKKEMEEKKGTALRHSVTEFPSLHRSTTPAVSVTDIAPVYFGVR